MVGAPPVNFGHSDISLFLCPSRFRPLFPISRMQAPQNVCRKMQSVSWQTELPTLTFARSVDIPTANAHSADLAEDPVQLISGSTVRLST